MGPSQLPCSVDEGQGKCVALQISFQLPPGCLSMGCIQAHPWWFRPSSGHQVFLSVSPILQMVAFLEVVVLVLFLCQSVCRTPLSFLLCPKTPLCIGRGLAVFLYRRPVMKSSNGSPARCRRVSKACLSIVMFFFGTQYASNFSFSFSNFFRSSSASNVKV